MKQLQKGTQSTIGSNQLAPPLTPELADMCDSLHQIYVQLCEIEGANSNLISRLHGPSPECANDSSDKVSSSGIVWQLRTKINDITNLVDAIKHQQQTLDRLA